MLNSMLKFFVALVLFNASGGVYAHPGDEASVFHIHGFELISMDFVLGSIIVAATLYLSVIGFRRIIYKASIH